MNYKQRLDKMTKITIGSKAKLVMGLGICTKRNVTLHVEKGIMKLGNNIFFNENCNIVARKSIQIGRDSTFGPNVCIYDHDHDYKKTSGEFIESEIIIGKNVWIGANSIVLRGAYIGNNCVIAAGTIVKGKIEENTMIYQKRENIIKVISGKEVSK